MVLVGGKESRAAVQYSSPFSFSAVISITLIR
jgi:hypothetical protein